MKFAETFFWQNFWIVAFIALGAGVASTPLMSAGWFLSHDMAPHLLRIFAVFNEMQQGDYYPRWLSLALYGKGLPDLNFYSPAFYLSVSGLNLVGLPLALALKATCYILSFFGAWGIFLWVRKYTDTAGGLISATLYLFLPYRFLDLFVRGAFPEFAALSLFPWLFHVIDLSFSSKKRHRGIVCTALISSAIVLTHHLSAIMIIPFALVYFGWHAVRARNDFRRVMGAAVGPVAGAGLSAFYWLPVMVEMKYLAYFENPVNIRDHFVYPWQWFSLKWDFGLSVPGPNDGMSFQIGLVLICMAAAAFLTLVLHPRGGRGGRGWGWLILGLSFAALILTTAYSRVFYQFVHPLQLIQFPWRFLGLATIFLAAFAGFATANSILMKFSCIRWALLFAIFAASIHLSSVHRTVKEQEILDLDALKSNTIAFNQVGGEGIMALEFLPKWANFHPHHRLDWVLWMDPEINLMEVSDLQIKGSAMTFSLTSDRPSQVVIPWYYFPGWKVRANGISIPVTASPEGFITFALPGGPQTVGVWFGSTWPRMAGGIIAAFTALFFCVSFFMQRSALRLAKTPTDIAPFSHHESI